MNRLAVKPSFVAGFPLVLLLAGCSNGSGGSAINPRVHITGSGVVVAQDRSVAPFQGLDMRIHADVRPTQSGSQSVRIETDDNIIDHLDTRVDNDVLIIQTDVDYTTLHGVIVTLDMIEIRSLLLAGVGSITGQNDFVTDDLTLTKRGVGSISVSGVANTLFATLGGLGMIDAEGLRTSIATVILSGFGDCRVTVTQELNATISGTGDIYFAGAPPVVNPIITGIGRLIPL